MLTSDFDYPLPPSAIAQEPSARRDACRLAAVDRATGSVTHARFRDLAEYLRPGDLLVLNDSKVLPARVPCRRRSGGAVEIFILDPLGDPDALPVFLRPAGRVKFGECVLPVLDPDSGGFIIKDRNDEGIFHVRWAGKAAWGPGSLQRIGLPPLPPYIHRDHESGHAGAAKDKAWYQTVYARHAGSVAAPTAGLHFTEGMLERLRAKGIATATVTLHVGAGTFQPVKSARLEDHPMHSESCEVPVSSAAALIACRRAGGRVIAVGTTSLRTLESCIRPDGTFHQGWMDTRLFIKPGYRFKCVDGLITNFPPTKINVTPAGGRLLGPAARLEPLFGLP